MPRNTQVPFTFSVVAFYGGAGLPGTSCLPCFPVRLPILYAGATIRYAAVHEKPAEHALPDAPRRRTDSSLHAAMRAPEPIVPDVFGAARAPDPDRDGDDAGKSGASDGRLHQGPIAREEAPAGPHNTRWPRRGSRSGTRRR